MLLRLRLSTLKYGAITLTNLQNQLAYIWDALNRAFFITFIMFIFVQLWTAAYQAKGTAEIAGLTLANTIWYFLIAEVMELGKPRHDLKISEEVKDGSIAYTLGRPYNYLAYHFFNGLGDSAVKMVLIFLLGAPIALAFFMGNAQQLSTQAVNAAVSFALYPNSLFSGAARFLLYTLVPAGFIGAVPVEIVKGRSLTLLLALLGVAILTWLIAAVIFYSGLRRYESGSAINVNL